MEATQRRFPLALLASVALAGTCLAAPGLALAGTAAEPDGRAAEAVGSLSDSADEGRDASDGATVYALGGVQVAIPDNFELVDLGYTALASNEDGSVVVSITPSDADAAVPEDDSQWASYFSTFSDASAHETSASSSVGEICDLADGTRAYAVSLVAEQKGGQAALSQCYVPLEDGTFTLVQIACDASNEEAAATAEAIGSSIARATDDALVLGRSDQGGDVPADQASAGVQPTQAGGLAFDLPAGYVADESSTEDEPAWHSADNTVMVGVLPGLISGYSSMDGDVFGMVATGIAENLGGTVESTVTFSNDGTDVDVYVFTFSSDGMEFVGALGMVALPDDTVTGMLALSPMSNVAGSDGDVTALFESIRLAE